MSTAHISEPKKRRIDEKQIERYAERALMAKQRSEIWVAAVLATAVAKMLAEKLNLDESSALTEVLRQLTECAAETGGPAQ